MPAKRSAGLLMYRRGPSGIEALLAHPGGPFWASRHAGAWTIPKGGPHEGETPFESAIREFREETGFDSAPPYLHLGEITQRGGKIVEAWAFEGDCDPSQLTSIDTTVEWPPRSGETIVVPEIDRARWFALREAEAVINVAQIDLLRRLSARLVQEPSP